MRKKLTRLQIIISVFLSLLSCGIHPIPNPEESIATLISFEVASSGSDAKF